MKKKIFIIIGTCIVFILAGVGVWWFMSRSENEQTKTTDKQRYQHLLAECQRDYQRDMKSGKRYFRYPCSPGDIDRQFKQTYGYDYSDKDL